MRCPFRLFRLPLNSLNPSFNGHRIIVEPPTSRPKVTSASAIVHADALDCRNPKYEYSDAPSDDSGAHDMQMSA